MTSGMDVHIRAFFIAKRDMSLAVNENETSAAMPLQGMSNDNTGIPTSTAAIVIVGSGPVGMRCVTELQRHQVSTPVIIYGAEPWNPYDRVKLSSYLAGDIGRDELDIAPLVSGGDSVETRYNGPIVRIDRQRSVVIDAATSWRPMSPG